MYIFHGMNEISDNASQNHQKPWTWAGLRPIRTLWFDQPPVGGVQIGLFKTTRQRATLSLVLLDSLPVLATRPPTPRKDNLEAGPLDSRLETNHLKSPRPCQSRNIAEPAASTPRFQHGSPVTSRNSDASQQSFPEQHVETHVRKRDKDPACLTNRKQVFTTESLFLTELVNWSDRSNKA